MPGVSEIRGRADALALLKRFAVREPGDILLEEFAAAHRVYVQVGGIAGAEARLVRRRGRGILRVRGDIFDEGRRRFAIAHDIGHIVCHPDISQYKTCVDADFTVYSKSEPEREANAFASELLMPFYLFRPKVEKAIPDFDLIRDLAEQFRTTLTATAIRFVSECERSCSVVYSRAGRIEWACRDPRTRGWIPRGRALHPKSLAAATREGRIAPGPMRAVPPEAWFDRDQMPRGSDFEVREQSTAMPRYDGVLTLLWFLGGDEWFGEEYED